MSNNNEIVYCQNCPIVNVCWGKSPQLTKKTNYENNCVLAKLYNGELKVTIETTGYVSKD